MTDSHHPGRSLPEVPFLSQMTQGLDREGVRLGTNNAKGDALAPQLEISDNPFKQPEGKRPWSAQGIKTILSPSPTFIEARRSSKDDHDIVACPVTPKRTNFASRGLSLQMPPRDVSSTSTANLSINRTPVSPRPDAPAVFTSPTSVLPRRARGIDFSRAATNLHHSTLAEQPSPESSPTVAGRRGIMIPPRGKGLFNAPSYPYNPESPSMSTNSLWTTLASTEKTTLSSSVASSSMMDDDSGSTSSDEDEIMDLGEDDDTVHMTPHISGISLMNPFGSVASSPGGDGVGHFSPHATKLMSYQRARINSRRSRTRKSSSSASAQSSMHSPGPPQSPPMMRSSESNMSISGGFFLDEPTKKEIRSRRESLSLGTNDMQLSDAEQSDDGENLQVIFQEDVSIPTPLTPSMEERKQVVRRAVTRRSNLMPKSKTFARVKAALLEEGAPIDTETRREAEVIRQVRESDADAEVALHLSQSQPTTSCSSPSLAPVRAGPTDHTGGFPDDVCLDEALARRRSSSAFTSQAIKNSGGVSFWNNFDERMRTPPPSLLPRASSSAICDDMNIDRDTPQSSVPSTTPQQSQGCLIKPQEASQPSGPLMPTTFEIPRKGNKRMRDDDFDPHYFKRRAVSPGLSVQNSPVLPQSPGWWGTPPPIKPERGCSNGSTSGSQNGAACGQPKRIGMQGMNDTNDGLMKMSIE